MKSSISIRTICQVAILIALEIVLSRFCSINTAWCKIGFGFLPIALCAMLFGPIWGGIAAAAADFLGATLFPIGPYFVGFTISAFFRGMVFGLFFYKKEKLRLFPDIFIPTLINCIVIGLLVDTYWVALLYTSKSYGGWFLYRLLQYAIMVPEYLLLLPLLSHLADRLKHSGFVYQKVTEADKS
ncbi:MAG: folate family ECF transporter S component [Oscillospiraceae bacterium]